jgi:hypothetical protein
MKAKRDADKDRSKYIECGEAFLDPHAKMKVWDF